RTLSRMVPGIFIRFIGRRRAAPSASDCKNARTDLKLAIPDDIADRKSYQALIPRAEKDAVCIDWEDSGDVCSQHPAKKMAAFLQFSPSRGDYREGKQGCESLFQQPVRDKWALCPLCLLLPNSARSSSRLIPAHPGSSRLIPVHPGSSRLTADHLGICVRYVLPEVSCGTPCSPPPAVADPADAETHRSSGRRCKPIGAHRSPACEGNRVYPRRS